MSFTFGDPVQADQFKNADHVGDLVAFVDPTRKDVNTQFGEQEATSCTYIVVLTGDEAGEVYDDSLVFGNLGRDAYSGGKEQIVLGRIATGKAKAGQSAPFYLEAATDDDKKLAGDWFTANAKTNAAGKVVID